MSENTPVLRWENIAPQSDLHAALYAQSVGRPVRVPPHGHADFCELFLVVEGIGTHITPKERTGLQGGDLRFLQPGDTHAFAAPEGSALCWINIAFPASAWRAFAAFAPMLTAPTAGVRLSAPDFATCAAVFDATLRAFANRRIGDRHALAAFLGSVLPYLSASSVPVRARADFDQTAPAWLRAAVLPFLADSATALAGGVPFLRERAGVSATHLARAMQTATGQTPTQWVNGRRLERAALLLSVSARAPTQIASDCGFHELGYFYRCFRERFGVTPGAYRAAARRTVP